jgi:thiol-disulfide isomerase/thioredoxin
MARGRSVRSARNNAVSMKGVSAETVVIVVLLIILLVLVVYYVRQNSEGFQSGEECTIYAFIADWCPHCKTAGPALNNLKERAPNNVNVNIVNEKDNNSRELMNKYSVRGFPTILLVKADGTVVEFQERVTHDGLLKFANSNSGN